MEHPDEQQWMAWLYGESPPADRRRLAEHLEGCPECGARVEAWRAGMQHLDEWSAEAKPRRIVRLMPALRLAAAAAVLVAVGFIAGRLVARPVSAETLKAELAAELRAQLQQDWAADIATSQAALRGEILSRLDADMSEWAVEVLAASRSLANDLAARWAEASDASLRSDILTLAALTEEEILRTRRGLAAALAEATASVPNPGRDAGLNVTEGEGGAEQ
jgi:anti-sigma factor RsiW